MDEKNNMEILLDIQNTLGTVVEATSSIKSDIVELKEKDLRQSDELEKAYEKAKARQDSIRDDLQHQIDNNKTLILTVSESINNLNANITKLVSESQESTNKKIEILTNRIIALETKKEKTLAKWWDRGITFLLVIAGIAILTVLLKWLGAPPEVMNQLPH